MVLLCTMYYARQKSAEFSCQLGIAACSIVSAMEGQRGERYSPSGRWTFNSRRACRACDSRVRVLPFQPPEAAAHEDGRGPKSCSPTGRGTRALRDRMGSLACIRAEVARVRSGEGWGFVRPMARLPPKQGRQPKQPPARPSRGTPLVSSAEQIYDPRSLPRS